MLPDYSPFGRAYEVNNILYLRRKGKLFLDFLNAFFHNTLGVEYAVGIVNEVDKFVAETMATQSDNVDACVSYRLLTSYNVGGDVLTETGTTLYHHIAAYLTELVTQHFGTDDGVVVDDYLAGKLGRVAYNEMVSKYTVVGHVHVFHQQVVIAYDGGAL